MSDSDKQKENFPDGPKYAGFNMRLLAAVIDVLVSIVVLYPTYLIYAYFSGLGEILSISPKDMSPEQQITLIVQSIWSTLLQLAVLAIVVVIFWIYKSATPGKMLLKMKIVDAKTMQKPSKIQFIGRCLAYLVSFLFIGGGFMWISIDKKRQGWHDKIAGTLVIMDR